jgi:class 3 adenylate cyclase
VEHASACAIPSSISSGLSVPIRIRISLNSGEVLVRAIGSDLHMDYTEGVRRAEDYRLTDSCIRSAA